VQFEEIGYGDVLTKLVRTIKLQTPQPAQRPRPVEARAPVEAQTHMLPRKKAHDRVKEWNSRYPVGIRVKATVTEYEGKDLETRTEAMVLFGHRAAVYMKGYNGYFDLDEVAPL
jgi:malonyl CoA-acyl carrier protein transacylase